MRVFVSNVCSALRISKATGAEVLAVGCPFCMQMFETAKSSVADVPVVKDVVELIAEGLE
jgi:Fe-S oxidoreductase